MGRNTWIAGLALWAGLGTLQSAEAQLPGPSTVRVLLTDVAGLPADTLERAKDEAARLFERSQINLEWIEEGACQARCLFVRVTAGPIGTKGSINSLVVGVAPGTEVTRGKFAWVFYDRIRVYSEELGLGASVMLGHVIAHELGHLLLPHNAHSTAGVMRAGWDRTHVTNAVDGLLTFTPAEAALIRKRLSALASRGAGE